MCGMDTIIAVKFFSQFFTMIFSRTDHKFVSCGRCDVAT
ncbi:hypothetical protein D1BOALGB6SA_9030 [Olavius sp. associated proteobacterium Delta 1]|nr:hypothetical protein D1BOALGB6SA_9030 [Olavius sp. associated proteobacterium Delta 1]